MPTGYTAPVAEKDLTFPQFALLCARAFGVCVSMKDDPLDKPIPNKIEPISTYHREELARCEEKLKLLLEMKTKRQKETWAKKKIKADIESTKKYKEEEEKRDDFSKYETMLKKVRAWTPPSKNHLKLKEFMENQLTETIKFENHSNSNHWNDQLTELEDKLKNPISYYNECVKSAKEDIKYHTDHWEKDVKQAEEATCWLQLLRESLKETK